MGGGGVGGGGRGGGGGGGEGIEHVGRTGNEKFKQNLVEISRQGIS